MGMDTTRRPRQPRQQSLQGLLVTLVASVVGLVTITMSLAFAMSEYADVRTEAAAETASVAHSTAILLEAQLTQQLQGLTFVATAPLVVASLEAGDVSWLNTRLEEAGAEAPDFGRLAIIDSDGRIVANSSSDKSAVGRSIIALPYVRAALLEGRASVGAPRASIGQQAAVPVLPLGVPIRARDGQVIGALQATIELTRMNADLATVRVGQSGRVTILSTDGRYLVHPDRSLLLKSQEESGHRVVSVNDLFGGLVRLLDGGPTPWYASAESMPSTGWTVCAELPVSEALEPLRQRFALGLLTAGITALVGTVLGMLLARRITGPLAELARAVDALERESEQTELPKSGVRELAGLADRFAVMRERLAERTAEQEAAEHALWRQAAGLEVLAGLNHTIVSSLARDEVLRQVVTSATTLLSADAASFWLVDHGERTLELRALSDEQLARSRGRIVARFDQGVAGWVAEHGERQHVADVFADGRTERLDWWRRHGLRALLALPVEDEGRVVGVLCLYSRAPIQLDATDEHVLALFVAQVGVALRNAALFESEATARAAAVMAGERFQALIEAAPDAVVIRDRDGRAVFVNRQAQVISGYSEDELLGTDLSQMIPVRLRDRQWAGYMQSLERPGEIHALGGPDSVIVRSDGVEIPLEGAATCVITSEGRQVISIIRDVSERLALERLKNQFVSMVSHELRTPLTPVIGLAELLAATPLTDQQARMAATIKRSGQHLLTVVNDLLDFSKIQAGQLALEAIEIDLRSLVEDTVDLLGARAGEKNLNLAWHVTPTTPALVRGDPIRLRQILSNLIANAIKFTSGGEVVVRVSLVDDAGGGALVRFSVTDTGIGIPEEALARLFEPFTQASLSTTREFGGTGLGLAICKQLAELMGGQIGVETSPGEGSTFWFTARFGAAPRPVVTAQPARDSRSEALRVLIVDDSAVNRLIFAEHLASWDMQSESCGTATETMARLHAAIAAGAGFHVALLDLNLGDGDGITLARTIRDDPALDGVRIMILSSSLGDGLQQRAARAGADAFLNKPIRRTRLLEAILATSSAEELDGSHPDSPDESSPRPIRAPRDVGAVLVVDDSAMNQLTVLSYLDVLGYRGVAVENGRQAVEAVKRGTYAAVLMDCQMPEMDGYEATRQIRIAEGPGQRMPIIAMTASAMAADRERCLREGMDDFISKPLDRDSLERALARWVDERSGSGSEDAAPSAEATMVTNDPTHVLELDRLRELASLRPPAGERLVHNMIGMFVESAAEQLRLIRESAQAADAAGVSSAAHRLTGESRSVGAVIVGELAHAIEELGYARRIPDRASDIEPLAQAIEAAVTALQQFRSTLGGEQQAV